jgi:phosphoglycerate kinase
MSKLSIVELPIKGKKVLMRVDFNVPLDKNQAITDDSRIQASLHSIKYVLEQGGALILMSHLGRPKEKRVPEMSLAPCAKRLSELLKKPVLMAPDCIGPDVEKMARDLKKGEILLLENLRFHRGEEHPEEDPEFVKQLAKLGDLYVNDAFGTAHRAHASTATITSYFPNKAAAGFLMEKEIKFLSSLLNPKRPFCAIIGGAKISTKMGVLDSLMKKADALLIGGGMAYTFFKAQGIPIGDSIHEDDYLDKAKMILENGSGIFLPQDTVVADRLQEGAHKKIVKSREGVPSGFQGVDIGPETVKQFISEMKKAATVLWNGPLGVYEIKEFAIGTQAVAEAIAKLNATTIVGGGDSIAALQQAGVADQVTHVSTGGGASLEYIELGTLPGIEALSDSGFSSKNRQ